VAVACGFLLVLTLVWKDWIEIVFDVDPDRHSGSLEWLIVVALAATTISLVIAGRSEWRRPRLAPSET
jgi:hypothetical protein